MVVMSSDVNDNYLVTVLVLSINNCNGAGMVTNVVLVATKSVIVMMAVMKRNVATLVLDMMLFLVNMVGSVPEHAMASLSATMDLMKGSVLLEILNFQVSIYLQVIYVRQ